MSVEIERKFLVINKSFMEEAYCEKKIKQGYLLRSKKKTVRVRVLDSKAYLTIKGESSKDGLERYEFEKEISLNEAQELFLLVDETIISKVRYYIKSSNHLFEVDVFEGDNKGLVLAEVELRSKTEKVILPTWIGNEVTGDPKYYNSQLIDDPFSKWE